MKSSMKTMRAIGNIDDDMFEEAASLSAAGVRRKERRITLAPWMKWAAPVAACLVIAVAAAVPQLMGPPPAADGDAGGYGAGAGTPNAGQDPNGLIAARLDTIRGLPAEDYTWDEGSIPAEAEFGRMPTNELRYLMREFGDRNNRGVLASFAIVKVESTKPIKLDSVFGDEGQLATCGVMYDVLGDSVGQELKIEQNLYGGCTGEDETNLLREGGVYVLSLLSQEGQDHWTVYGDLDGLFEVDGQGLIHSHSRYPGMSKYDGRPLSELWADIEYLYARPLYHSWLAEEIGYGMDIEFVNEDGQDVVHLYEPTHGWDVADSEAFAALVVNDVITIPAGAPAYNHFRPFAGMTKGEFLSAIEDIKAFLGQEGDDRNAP
jgi:hypothetical protein